MAIAHGEFEVKLSLQPQEPEVAEAGLGRMLIDKQFRGDLQGVSQGQMLSAATEMPGSAGYVALERVSGNLHGRNGNFVLQHSGTLNRGRPSLNLTVVPDSGSDSLVGLRGEMEIIIEGGRHNYVFDYDFGSEVDEADEIRRPEDKA